MRRRRKKMMRKRRACEQEQEVGGRGGSSPSFLRVCQRLVSHGHCLSLTHLVGRNLSLGCTPPPGS